MDEVPGNSTSLMARRWNAIPSEQVIKMVGELLMDSQSMMGLQRSGTLTTRDHPVKNTHKYHCHIGNRKCQNRCCWHRVKDARDISFFPFWACSIKGNNILHFAKGWERRRTESSDKLIPNT
uniref:Uncharacterized protein n=1 Tax=Myotis myotis TaxID=51298 RepID=A0A7J7T681_MYOMY|nr:hypothetical protein mMyoMyo1_009262 [Myotis myotis]